MAKKKRFYDLLREYGFSTKGQSKEAKALKAEFEKVLPGVSVLSGITPEQEQKFRNYFDTKLRTEADGAVEVADAEELPRMNIVRGPVGEADDTVVLNKDPNFYYRWVSTPDSYGDKQSAGGQYGLRMAQGYEAVDAAGKEVAPFAVKRGNQWVKKGQILMRCPREMREVREAENRRRQEALRAQPDAQFQQVENEINRELRKRGVPPVEMRVREGGVLQVRQRQATGRFYSIPSNVKPR